MFSGIPDGVKAEPSMRSQQVKQLNKREVNRSSNLIKESRLGVILQEKAVNALNEKRLHLFDPLSIFFMGRNKDERS